MSSYAKDLTESRLAEHLCELARQLDLSIIGREIPIGAYRLDALAVSPRGDVAIIELKVVASTNTLGQLLLYTRAVRNRLRREGWPGQVRGLLITTHLDSNVADVVSELQSIQDLTLKVCVGTEPGALRLVEPREAPPEQIWDQSTVGGRCGVRVVGGRCFVPDRSNPTRAVTPAKAARSSTTAGARSSGGLALGAGSGGGGESFSRRLPSRRPAAAGHRLPAAPGGAGAAAAPPTVGIEIGPGTGPPRRPNPGNWALSSG